MTAAGETMPLPEPFFVLATQNPIEQEGTYPLPEAQLDRFLFDIRVGYPNEDEEVGDPARDHGRASAEPLAPVLDAAQAIARCSGWCASCRRPSRCCATRRRSCARRVPTTPTRPTS